MANRVDYAVSTTAIKSTTYGVDYSASDVTDLTSQAHDYIEPNIGKTLGGSGSIQGLQQQLEVMEMLQMDLQTT